MMWSAAWRARWCSTAAAGMETDAQRLTELRERVRKRYGVETADDWRKLCTRELKAVKGGPRLLAYCNGSVSKAVALLAPDACAMPRRRLREHWLSKENRIEFLRRLEASEGITAAEEWRRVTRETVRRYGGAGLLQMRGNSVTEAATELYPCLGDPAPSWDSAEHRRAFLDRLLDAKGIEGPRQWQALSQHDVVAAGGSSLLKPYKGNVSSMLRDAYPEQCADPALFYLRKMPNGHWRERENRRKFLDFVKERMRVQSSADWGRVKVKDLLDLGGRGLLDWAHFAVQERGGSRIPLRLLLEDCYPEEDFRSLWKSRRFQTWNWESKKDRRVFLDSVAEAMGIVRHTDWKAVRVQDILDMGGRGLLQKMGSLHAALLEHVGDVVPASALQGRIAPEHWDDDENVRQFVQYAAEKLLVRDLQDWRRVPHADVQQVGGSGLLRRVGLRSALETTYGVEAVESAWGNTQQEQAARKSQRMLAARLAALVPELRTTAAS